MSKSKRRMSKSNRRQIVLLIFLLILVSAAIVLFLKFRSENVDEAAGKSGSSGLIPAQNGGDGNEEAEIEPDIPYYSPQKITHAEAEDLFRAANAFYVKWILQGPELDDKGDYEKRVVEDAYLPVTEAGFSSIEAIKRACAAYFGAGAFDKRIDWLYLEHDGKLYARMDPEGEGETGASPALGPDDETAYGYFFQIADRDRTGWVTVRVTVYTDEDMEDSVTVTNTVKLVRGFPPFDAGFNAIVGYAGAGIADDGASIEVETETEPETESETVSEETESEAEDE